ncbi:MAG: hypothetical protein ACRD0Z_04485, partial [Acidimicrobiales bacterium]
MTAPTAASNSPSPSPNPGPNPGPGPGPGGGVLAPLAGLLSGEAAIAELLSVDDTVVAVPEAARAVTVAALAELSSAPVLVVATPTAREAEQLEHDLAAFVGRDAIDVLPAWETLPFERVSPATDTMGRRLRSMWHLRQHASAVATAGEAPPRILIAPIRALLQRLGPRVEDAEPLVVERGSEVDAEELVAKLVHAGYRREYQVEHRGELAVRGGIVDVFPSTADEAIRIDLWGDEVERLTVFDVSDQRSTHEIGSVEIFGCRELVLTDEVRERAALLAKEAPFARDVFEKIAEGLVFDGMESWLPWLTDEERLFTDLLGVDARVVLIEPRRLRDRAADLVEEESSLAEALLSTWVVASPVAGRAPSRPPAAPGSSPAGSTPADAEEAGQPEELSSHLGGVNLLNLPEAPLSDPSPAVADEPEDLSTVLEGENAHELPGSVPTDSAPVPGSSPAAAEPAVARLHLPFERLLAKTGARLASFVPSAENTDMTTLVARAWPPVLGDSVGLAKRLGDLARSDHRVVVCADGRGSAERIAAVLGVE